MYAFLRKTVFFFILLFGGSTLLLAQNGSWTWMAGDTTGNPMGNFGIQGVSAPSNRPPGLYEAAEWTDLNGNFWLFGGNNLVTWDAYSALWKFDPNTLEWTWVKGPSAPLMPGIYGTQGVPSPLNYPGYREYGCVTWVDAAGDLWLYGGRGPDINGVYGSIDELWRYNIATNEWTWMKGSGTANQPGIFGVIQLPSPINNPPGTDETACGWTDAAGDFWMFGGERLLGANSDAMWRYNIATNEWTWMSGQNTGPVVVNYGTLQVASPTNTPGTRRAYAHWEDLQGNFWLYGGNTSGAVNSPSTGIHSDMWKYDPATLQWTWMAGNSVPYSPSTFTAQCLPGNGTPQSVYENRVNWRDQCGRFWSLSGATLDSAVSVNNTTSTSTLWCFDPQTFQFVWVSGPLTSGAPAVYGTQGVPSTLNRPASLAGANSFISASGDFWLCSGLEMYQGASTRNTMWRYQPDPSCPVFPVLSTINLSQPPAGCAPYAVQFAPSVNGNYSFFWDFGDASTLTDTSVTANSTYTFQQAGTYTVTLITQSQNTCYTGSDTSLITITVHPNPVVNLGNDTTLCSPPVNLLLDAGNPGATYQWSTGATSQTITATAAGTYSITVSSGPGNVCTDQDSIVISLAAQPSLGNDTVICAGQTLLLDPGVSAQQYIWNTGDTTSTLLVNTAGLYSVQIINQPCTLATFMNLGIAPVPVVNLGADTLLCPGDTLLLDAQNSGANYNWNTGAVSQTIEVTAGGTYAVTVTAQNCPSADSLRVDVMQDVDFDESVSLCGTSNALVLDAGNPGAAYSWSTGETTQTITVQQAGDYWVIVNNPPCLLIDTARVNGILGEGLVFVPNSFTPNNDGLNDRFTGIGENFTSFHLIIFNRWGELIFETRDQSGWDGIYQGEIAKGDVYVYKLSYSNICTGEQVVDKLGHVTLIR
jgi:gliding motility-associated-like protein